MEKDRSDFAVMNRMIDHIRLLIAVDDEAIPVKKKLEAQALLKDFQACSRFPKSSRNADASRAITRSCAVIWVMRPMSRRCWIR